MHYFNFILEDKPWNDVVKVNQYLFLGRFFWMMSMGQLPDNEIDDTNKMEDLSDLNKNLTSFSSTFMALVELMRVLGRAGGDQEIAYLLTTEDYPSVKELIAKIRGDDSAEMISEEEATLTLIGLQQNYSKIVFLLDDSYAILKDILEREKSNLDIVRIWQRLQYVYFNDMIKEAETKMVSWDNRTLWLEKMDEEQWGLLSRKLAIIHMNLHMNNNFENLLKEDDPIENRYIGNENSNDNDTEDNNEDNESSDNEEDRDDDSNDRRS